MIALHLLRRKQFMRLGDLCYDTQEGKGSNFCLTLLIMKENQDLLNRNIGTKLKAQLEVKTTYLFTVSAVFFPCGTCRPQRSGDEEDGRNEDTSENCEKGPHDTSRVFKRE